MMLAELIRSHRRKAGLTQARLAELAGVGKTVVWDLEHGKESVRWDTLQKLFGVLNVSVAFKSPLLARAAAASLPPDVEPPTVSPAARSE